MKALSLLQPWASLVVSGSKNIENRRWHLPKSMQGQTWLVHASARLDKREIESARRTHKEIRDLYEESADAIHRSVQAGEMPIELPLGGIIGIVRSTACLCPSKWDQTADQEYPWWFGNQHGFVLEDRHPLPFVPCKGALGFWTVPDDVLRQLGLADVKKRRCDGLIPTGSRCSVLLDAAEPRTQCDVCANRKNQGTMHV